MKNILKIIICFFSPSVFFSFLLMGNIAGAANNALDFELVQQEKRTDFALRLEARPEFSLRPIRDDLLLLTIGNTNRSPAIERRVSEIESIELDHVGDASDLGFLIRLPRPFIKIENSWIPEKRFLYLCINLDMITQETKAPVPTETSLKDIRFGIKDDFTRMVLNLDKKPSWEMLYNKPQEISLHVNSLFDLVDNRRYGPFKYIKDITVARPNNDKTVLDIRLETDLNRMSIFWLMKGNRLVMDLHQAEANMDDEILLRTADLETGNGGIDSNEENKLPESEQEPFAHIARAQAKETIPNKTEHIVKRRIPERDTSYLFEEKGVDGSKFMGKEDSFFPGPRTGRMDLTSSISLRSVKDMSPKEAFVFGRIQQALEINDYEKAVLLVNQFLDEFPQTDLFEMLFYLRGDLYSNLHQKGDTDAAEMAIQSYLYATDRFPNSEYATLANIKISQINSELGNNYKAIGRLSMVISRGDKDYLPLAYITRGRIYLKMDQFKKAIEDFKTLLNTFPGSDYTGEAHFWIANYFHMMGLYEEAEKRLKEVLDSRPDFPMEYPEFLFLRAQNFVYLNRYDQAREELFKALNIGHQPETSDLLLSRIGDTFHHQDKKKKAEKFYRMVIDYYPESEGAAISKLRLADYYKDISILEDLTDDMNAGSVSELALLEKGYRLFEKQQYRLVLESISDLVGKPIKTETRKEAERLFNQAAAKGISSLYEEERYNELVDLYRSEQERLKGNINAEALLLVGRAFNALNLYEEAVNVFSQFKPYDLDPRSRGTYYLELAGCRISLGENDKAQNLLEVVKQEKGDINHMRQMDMLLADIYMGKDMFDKAFPLYESMVKAPDNPDDMGKLKAYLQLGKIFYAKRDYERAKISLNRCISIAEKIKNRGELLQQALMELGRTYYKEQEFQKAIDSFEQGFSAGYDPESRDYWERRFQLALSYIGKGEDSKAIPLLTEISEEGDTILQQKSQIRLGSINLTRALSNLSMETQ